MKFTSGVLRVFICFCFLAFFRAPEAYGFGQNKIQFERFEWSYLQTKHFDIYFTQDGSLVARFAAQHVEELYQEVSNVVGYSLRNRVPIIVHTSHAEFSQTNVVPMQLPEAVGGFTERFKNRVVLPFEGSYPGFHHVLQHELVHAVMFDMFAEGGSPMASIQMAQRLPLWFDEGLAEYISLGWNLESEFFLLDAVTFGYIQPPTRDFGGFLAYKGGQSFYHFVDKVFGEGTVTRLVQAVRRNRGDLPGAFQSVTRTSLEEAGEIWLRELRAIHWPELGAREYGKRVAKQLTQRPQDLSNYNLQPAISPDGKHIAFFSDRQSWEGIFVLDVKTEKIKGPLARSGEADRHLSFNSFKSGLAWSPDSRQLAVVSQKQGRNVIHILDARSGKVIEEIAPPLHALLSPAWSPDGKRIAFSGLDRGMSDIYLWDREKQAMTRLTSDMAHDDKPAFSPSGEWIAFESDRMPEWDTLEEDTLSGFRQLSRHKDIYRIRTTGGMPELLVGGAFDEKMPAFGPSDSLMVFVSNRSGVDNLYLLVDSLGHRIQRPMSNLLSGCFTPSWSRDGKSLAFSLFERGGWDIFLMRNPLERQRDEPLPESHFIRSTRDSAAQFYRRIAFANLSSFKKDSTGVSKSQDSVAADGSKSTPTDTASLPDSGKSSGQEKPIPSDTASLQQQQTIGSAGDEETRDESSGLNEIAGSSGRVGEKAQRLFADTAVARADTAPELASRIDTSKAFLQDSSTYLTEAGEHRVKPYRPIFSMDMANAALGFSTYAHSMQGQAFITFSDLMGDQRISFTLYSNGSSLLGTNAVVIYDYLPHRPDFTIYAAHLANEYFLRGGELVHLDRQWGLGGSVRFPLSVFTRLQLDASYLVNTRESEVWDGRKYRSDTLSDERVDVLSPRLAWVHDNSQWGIVGPINGRRMMVGAKAVPSLTENIPGYWSLDGDFRRYWRLWKKYTIAGRVAGGYSRAFSEEENPHGFYVGGDHFTLNGFANETNLPSDLVGRTFLDYGLPLRGFDYFDFKGDRMFLTNWEFRFPFVDQFTLVWPLPVSIRHVQGVLFADYGGAWSRGNAFEQLGFGYGWGLRANLGIFVLRYTRAEALNRLGIDKEQPRHYWSLGAEF